MTTVQILEGALDKLRRDGWTQRDYMNAAGAVCLEGALASAQGVDVVSTGNNWDHDVFCSLQCDAAWLVRKLIGSPLLSCWNDTPGRTLTEIEAALTAAIAIAKEQEASQEQPAPAVEVTA